MSRKILIAAVMFAAPAPSPVRQIRPPPPLQIAVEDAADPWSRADGAGFANDVVRAAFRAVNIDVRLVVVPYARCKNMVIEGAVAACFTMSPATDLARAVQFPAQPLFTIHTDLVHNPAHPLPSAELSRLPRGTVIGTVLGYEYPKEVVAAQKAGIVVFEESPSESILLRKLAAGRVDGVLIDLNESKPLAYVAAQAEVVSGFRVAGRVGTMPAYIGFSAKNPRGPPARVAYDEGMRRIAANGALAQVVRRWTDSSRTFVQARAGGGRSGNQ